MKIRDNEEIKILGGYIFFFQTFLFLLEHSSPPSPPNSVIILPLFKVYKSLQTDRNGPMAETETRVRWIIETEIHVKRASDFQNLIRWLNIAMTVSLPADLKFRNNNLFWN